jgi:copper(I)-binding protein
MKRPGLAATLVLVTALASCSSPGTADSTSATPGAMSDVTGTGEAVDASAGGSLSVTDAWVKAATVEGGMTGAFGVLTNDGEQDVHVVGISSPVAGRAELHETVAGDGGAMVMQEMSDGFVVEAGEEHELVPGGDHLMLMELTEDIEADDEVEIALELEGGATVTFVASGRTFSGANEEYGSHGEENPEREGMESSTGMSEEPSEMGSDG